MRESDIQNKIRIAISEYGVFFRVNVGKGWAGEKAGETQDGSIILRNPRVFSTGVPAGFSDLFGVRTVEVTEDMIGQRIGQAVFFEVKNEKGRATKEQQNFIKRMREKGAIAVIVRSPEEACEVLKA